MENAEIAKVLREMGDILEIKGADSFKIRAFQNAARSIEFAAEEVFSLYQKEGLKGLMKIPGIGQGIAERVEELLKKGKLAEFEQLKGKIPKGELEITTIPGIGPKLAKRLYQKLKTKSIDDLEKKLQKISPDKLSGIHLKEKSIAKILKGIAVLRKVSGRKVLPFAEPIAREIVEKLKSRPEVRKADVVGSLRRWKETVGDIDIIAASKKPLETIEFFVKLPFWSEILAKGDTKATVVHQEGIQVDLEILPRQKYGSLLQHFTGSKEHNVALRIWAEKQGFSVSEHGIKKFQISKSPAKRDLASRDKIQKEKLILCSTEEEVYKTLGMDWIPPELRENQGEIEAALKHKLPNLIQLKDIKGDLQIHTNWTDGKSTIEEMAKEAKKMGYQYIAITDHSKGLS
ncbi:DNA polymerase III, partial [Candidatus Berkelbacteria bacterium]|nr:DNA polymerase III [Candidatus Berkelbacteria bacterium]